MSVELNDITSGYSTGLINDNFQKLEAYLNESLLNRDNVETGEPNHMEVALDMNGNSILNVVTDPEEPSSLITRQFADERYVDKTLWDEGYVLLADYLPTSGITLEKYNQVLRDTSGELWRLNTATPLPYTTDGSGMPEGGAFVAVGDSALRQDLASGTAQVTSETGSQTIAEALDSRVEKGQVGPEEVTTPDSTGTVSGKFTALEDRVKSPTDESGIAALADIGKAYSLQSAKLTAERTNDLLQDSDRYYHFGIMDMLPDGSLIIGYRDGDTHIAEGDDGKLVYSKVVNGQITAPTVIAERAGTDFRAGTGGVLPNGRLVFATNLVDTSSYPPAIWDDIEFYASDDFGQTWTLTQTIPATQDNYKIPYGKGKQIGGKFVIPYYERDASNGNIKARLLETEDGLTWAEGATIIDSAVDYNEFEVEYLGDDLVVAISRVGGGGDFRQFLSTDGGTTWTDSGNLTFTGESGNTLVSPALTTFTNSSGKQFLLIVYCNRSTAQMRYRYKAVSEIAAGSTTWVERSIAFYSAPTLSGYPSIVNRDGVIHICFFRETTAETESTVALSQLTLGDIPDYDSGYFSVSPSTVYTQNHGLGRKPSRVEILFSTTDSGGQDHFVYPGYFNDGANKGVGAEYAVNSTEVKVATGHALFGNGYFGDLGFGTRLTSGFYRIKVWL